MSASADADACLLEPRLGYRARLLADAGRASPSPGVDGRPRAGSLAIWLAEIEAKLDRAPFRPDRWEVRFLGLAQVVAGWSKDAEAKIGCVVAGPQRAVLATGYNGCPRGVEDTDERTTRAGKYLFTAHAEANAIAQAARDGVSLTGATAYVTADPCAACAALLIQAGVKRVIAGAGELSPAWRESREAARAMFLEAAVTFRRARG